MSEERKTTLVRFEFDDNTYRQLIGLEIEKWDKMVQDVCVLAFSHNSNPDWNSLHWQEGKIRE